MEIIETIDAKNRVNKMKILVTPTSMQPGKNEKMLDLLRGFSEDLVFNPFGKPLTEDELIPLLRDCDGFLAGLDFITEKVLDECPHLKVISRYGAGYDRVDIEAAKKRGIIVTNTPGVNSQAVAELTFGLIISLARKIPSLDASTKSGGWVRNVGMELNEKTLGILGLGAIGKILAKCGQGFGMNVIAYDPYIDLSYCEENHIKSCLFEELTTASDVISLHMPLNDETYHIIGRDAFEKMKDGVIVVNTSRGGIIDEDAAIEALKSGKLGGLGLDAFEEEPPKDTNLFGFDNVITTPHTGAHTKEAIDNMALNSIKNLIDVLSGKDCSFVVL